MYQPTPHQQARARRSAYAPADEGEGMCTTVVAILKKEVTFHPLI